MYEQLETLSREFYTFQEAENPVFICDDCSIDPSFVYSRLFLLSNDYKYNDANSCADQFRSFKDGKRDGRFVIS
ncbi:hypothetical protein TCA2_1812 [Paenibacillus sp. TCA20]|nr:hypothetical protein TCA2_1812 [Paenibacillus sp. TCA20]